MQVIVLPGVALLQLCPLLVGKIVDHVPDKVQPKGNLRWIRGELALLLLPALVVERKGLGLGRDANVLAGIATVEEQALALDLRVDDALVENENLGPVAALQLVIEHLELVHLAEFALIEDIELEGNNESWLEM